MELGVQASVSLGQSMDRLSGLLQDRADAEAQAHTLLVNPQKELVSAGATAVLADLGGPQGSFVWDVRRVTIGGVPGDPIPTLGTQLLICKGSASSVGMQWTVDIAPTLPTAATYGSGEFILRSPDHLVVIWQGGTGTIFIDVDAAERPKVTRLISVA